MAKRVSDAGQRIPHQGPSEETEKDNPLKPPPPAHMWRVTFDPGRKPHVDDRLESAHVVIVPMLKHAQFMRYVLDGDRYALATTAMYTDVFAVIDEGLEAPSPSRVQ